MHAIILSLLSLSPGAFAQYGHGYYGALNCPQPYAPAPAAVDPNDLLLNTRGLAQASAAEARLQQQRIVVLNAQIAQERAQLQGILGVPVITAIEAHRRGGFGPAEYAVGCPAAPAVAGPPMPVGNLALRPTPPGFCVNAGGRVQNLWVNGFAGPGGLVNESICLTAPPAFRVPLPGPRANACRLHLRNYYQRLAEEASLEQHIAALNSNARLWQAEETELLNAQTQARTCVGCNLDQHEWSANQSLGGELAPIVLVMQALLGGNVGGLNRAFAGGGFGEGFGPYPSEPYVARLRGYYGARGGQWGGVPGGIGRGAFGGCGGAGALGRGAQFAPPVLPALNQRVVNPLDPRYANSLLDPSLQNDLFNPGFGPGFGPNVGNGLNLAPRYLPAIPQQQFVAQPLRFAQAPQFAPPVTQLGFGNLGAQLGPGALVGSPVVQNVFRPPVAAPAVLPAVASLNPGFAVGQPMAPAVGYSVLATQVNRAQYGLGVIQGAPAALPFPQVMRPPAPPVLPAIRSY